MDVTNYYTRGYDGVSIEGRRMFFGNIYRTAPPKSRRVFNAAGHGRGRTPAREDAESAENSGDLGTANGKRQTANNNDQGAMSFEPRPSGRGHVPRRGMARRKKTVR